MIRTSEADSTQPPANELFDQMARITPSMRVLCVGFIDFSEIAEVSAKRVASDQSRALFSKCTLKIQPGKFVIGLIRYGIKQFFIGTLEVIDTPMVNYWTSWAAETTKKGSITIGWRYRETEDVLPYVACPIADLVTPGVSYAFCLSVNREANRKTDFTVETSVLGELPPRDTGNLFYPSDSRGSLYPIPTSEMAWVLPMSTEIANVHIWIYNLAVFHDDADLARSLLPIMQVKN